MIGGGRFFRAASPAPAGERRVEGGGEAGRGRRARPHAGRERHQHRGRLVGEVPPRQPRRLHHEVGEVAEPALADQPQRVPRGVGARAEGPPNRRVQPAVGGVQHQRRRPRLEPVEVTDQRQPRRHGLAVEQPADQRRVLPRRRRRQRRRQRRVGRRSGHLRQQRVGRRLPRATAPRTAPGPAEETLWKTRGHGFGRLSAGPGSAHDPAALGSLPPARRNHAPNPHFGLGDATGSRYSSGRAEPSRISKRPETRMPPRPSV